MSDMKIELTVLKFGFLFFHRLREVVPKLEPDYKLSKFETLQMAQTYIAAMCEMLEKNTDELNYSIFNSFHNISTKRKSES